MNLVAEKEEEAFYYAPARSSLRGEPLEQKD